MKELETIYVYVPPALLEVGKAPKIGADANTIDVWFAPSVPTMEVKNDRMYQIPLGIKSYSLSSDMVCIPRSSSSKIEDHRVRNRSLDDAGIRTYSRSSIVLENTTGYIDWNYRGEWMARISTNCEYSVLLSPNSKPYLQAYIVNPNARFRLVTSMAEIPSEYLEPSQRGEGGFGSTDGGAS